MGNNDSKIPIIIPNDELYTGYNLGNMFESMGLKYMDDESNYNSNSLELKKKARLKITPKQKIISGSTYQDQNYEVCPFYMNKDTYFITKSFSKWMYELIEKSADNFLNEISNNLNNNPEAFIINNLYERFHNSFQTDSQLINLPLGPVGIKSDSNLTGYKFYSSDFNFKKIDVNDDKSVMNESRNETSIDKSINNQYRSDIYNFLDAILNNSFTYNFVTNSNNKYILIKLPNQFQVYKFIEQEFKSSNLISKSNNINELLIKDQTKFESENFILLSQDDLSSSDLISNLQVLCNISIPILNVKINNENGSETFNLQNIDYIVYINSNISEIKDQNKSNDKLIISELSFKDSTINNDKFKFMSKKIFNNSSFK